MDNSRRSFIKKGIAGTISVSMLPQFSFANPVQKKKIKLGFIGVGLRGTSHLRNALYRDDIEIPAICDIDPERIKVAQELITKNGHPKAEANTDGEFAYKKLLQRDDIDGVIIATPWLWHTRMAVDTMKAGKYAGVEVSAANTLEECWDLVNTFEQTKTPVMILENVCYRRDVMAILNMVRQDMFGELAHCHCGYQHDLRHVKFNPGVEFGEKGLHEAKWRTQHSVERNGDVYPTHGIGPIANMLDINRGNRFVSLVSFATKSKGLHDFILNHPEGGEEHPNADVEFKLGDIVTTLIKTSNEETILVSHDTNLPRPYSLGFRVQGTKGLWMKDGDQIYIEGVSEPHRWESSETYLKKYDHPLWQKYADKATGSGHGGMDFFVLHAFVESIKRQVNTPLDAYDAATWSAITPLSEESIAMGGQLQLFPDFTRGQWMKREPIFALNDEY